MKYLIVGLGNAGPDYVLTRHNAGFIVLDRIAIDNGLSFRLERHAYITEIKHKGHQLTLIKPTTYMNLSGKALVYWMTHLKIPLENVLVLVDDLALPLGKLRMKERGSSAGHNGLRHIQEVLRTDAYPRLRIGIGDDFPKGRQVDWVLGRFSEDELLELSPKIDKAIEMIFSFCTIGITRTMNLYNE